MRYTCVYPYGLLFLILAAVSLILFGPSLNGEFIMDDWGYITQNAWVTQSPTPFGFWTTFKQTDYWPLSYTFYWIFYRLFGESTFYYHLINVLLHALNGVLVFVLARNWRIRWPIWVALLFVVHPLHVQTVSWIIQFKTLLSTALALGCLIFYARYLNETRCRWLGLSLLTFTLAVLAKTSVVFLPLVMLGLSVSKPLMQKLRLTPFFVVSLLGGLATLKVNDLNFHDRQAQVFQMPWSERPLLMIQNLLFYVKSFFFPMDLAYMYPLRVPTIDVNGGWLLAAGILLLVFIMLYQVFPLRRDRRFYFYSYLVLLFPCLGLIAIPNMKLSLVADHWAYLPDVFLALYVGSVVKTKDTRFYRALLTVPLVLLAILTFRHARTFATEEAFWLRARDLNPNHAAPAYNLGTVYGKKNRNEESIEQYRRAVQLDSEHHRAWFNLGRAFYLTKEFEKSEECFMQAVLLNPGLIAGYLGLSKVYDTVGDRERSLQI
ncbi:MAG: tetratricopeptide repeat protein, partial [Bdellovibrionaceae bacterium]|nr:tetratricopeptide repeat protein [Pseudobdellovibrionaceae bacterium]